METNDDALGFINFSLANRWFYNRNMDRLYQIPNQGISRTIEGLFKDFSGREAGINNDAVDFYRFGIKEGWYRNGKIDEWYQLHNPKENKFLDEVYHIYLKTKRDERRQE